MRTGISVNSAKNGFCRYGEKRYEKINEYGFQCVDFSMADTAEEFYSLQEQEFSNFFYREKKLADASKIEISQVHAPWRWPPQDSSLSERAERLEKMKKSIKATALLGCKYWVIHPIMPFGTEDLDLNKSAETWKMNLDFMKKLLRFAKKNGVTVCLENMPMPRFSMATPQKVLEFVNEINDENFKICLDTGHVAIFNDLSIADVIYSLGDKIKVLHIHDNNGTSDEHLAPYNGVTDWDGFTKALNEIDFNGVISLETSPDLSYENEKFDEECIKLCEIAKELADKATK